MGTNRVRIMDVLEKFYSSPLLGRFTAEQIDFLCREIREQGICTVDNRMEAVELLENAIPQMLWKVVGSPFIDEWTMIVLREKCAQPRDPRSTAAYHEIALIFERALDEERMAIEDDIALKASSINDEDDNVECDHRVRYYEEALASAVATITKSDKMEATIRRFYRLCLHKRHNNGRKRDKFALWVSRERPTRRKMIKLVKRQSSSDSSPPTTE